MNVRPRCAFYRALKWSGLANSPRYVLRQLNVLASQAAEHLRMRGFAAGYRSELYQARRTRLMRIRQN